MSLESETGASCHSQAPLHLPIARRWTQSQQREPAMVPLNLKSIGNMVHRSSKHPGSRVEVENGLKGLSSTYSLVFGRVNLHLGDPLRAFVPLMNLSF